MKVGINSTEEWDKLTSKELDTLEPDEFVYIRKRRDLLNDLKAERLSTEWVSDEEAAKRTEQAGIGSPEQSAGYQLNQALLTIEQFEYMTAGQPKDQEPWHIFDVLPDGTRGPAVAFTRENRFKFVNLNGAAFIAQMAIRGASIAPDLTGKVDPDTGEALTFPQDDSVPVGGQEGQAAVAGVDSAGSGGTA